MLRFGILVTGLIAVLSIAIYMVVNPLQTDDEAVSRAFADAFGLTSCEQPCWHGIELGKTTFDEAKRILGTNPNIMLLGASDNGCQINVSITVRSESWIARLCSGAGTQPTQAFLSLHYQAPTDLYYHQTLTLHDVTSRLGHPIGTECTVFFSRSGHSSYAWQMMFKSGTKIGGADDLPQDGWLFGPMLHVYWIVVDANNAYAPSLRNSWRYFALERFQAPNNPSHCTVQLVK